MFNRLPIELIHLLTDYLTIKDFFSLQKTSLSFKEILNDKLTGKKLVASYYGKKNICLNPNNKQSYQKYQELLKLALYRWESNQYLESLGDNIKKICKATLRTKRILSVILLKDDRLATFDDRAVRVWDLTRPKNRQCIAGLQGYDYYTCFRYNSPAVTKLNDGWLSIVSQDFTVRVWDLNRSKKSMCVGTLKGYSDPVTSVIHLNKNRLASFDNKTIKVWDLNRPKKSMCVATLRVPGAIKTIQLKNGLLATTFGDNTVQVLDLNRSEESMSIATLQGHTDTVKSVIELKDGRLVTTFRNPDSQFTVKVWDLTQPEESMCVATLLGHTNPVRDAIQLNDGLLATFDCHTVNVWDLTRPKNSPCVATFRGDVPFLPDIHTVIKLNDGWLATTSNDNTVKVWDLNQPKNNQCVATLQGHTDAIKSVIQLKDGRLATASYDQTVRVWDLTQPKNNPCIATLRGTDKNLLYNPCFIIQLDDGRLVTAFMHPYSRYSRSTVKVWDLTRPKVHQ